MIEHTTLLTSSSPQLLIANLKEYSQNGKLSDLQAVLSFSKHKNSGVKAAAVNAACSIIKENLITYYHDLAQEVRSKLGILLETLDPDIVDEISKDLYSELDERRLRTVQIVGLLKKNPRIRDVLTRLVSDRDVKIRATAVNLLGRIIGPNDQQLLLSLLNDADKRVRANTIEALESLGNKRTIPILLRFRKDSNNRIRGNIIKALYNLGYDDIEQDILDMLAHTSDFMKASALWVITQTKFSSTKIEDAAGLVFMSDNEMVFRNAKNALSAIGSPRARGYITYLGDLPHIREYESASSSD